MCRFVAVHFVRNLGPPERGINGNKSEIAILPRPGTNLPAMIRLAGLELPRVHTRGLRYRHVRTLQRHVQSLPEHAGAGPGSVRGLAVTARARSGGPRFPVARQHDVRVRRRRAIRRLAGGSRNAIRCSDEWT
jgi:hypothetical protein